MKVERVVGESDGTRVDSRPLLISFEILDKSLNISELQLLETNDKKK